MNSFFNYIDKLELIAFFSAFPLFYFLIISFYSKPLILKFKFLKLLPVLVSMTYATMTVLYLGMKLNQWYLQSLISHIQIDYFTILFFLKLWVVLGLLFFFHFFQTKPILALAHSSIYFLILLIDFFQYYHHQIQAEVFHNEMRLYIIGFFANSILFSILFTLRWMIFKYTK